MSAKLKKETKNFKVLLVYTNAMLVNMVPVHLSLLAACLRRKGFTVELFDTTCYRTENVQSEDKRVDNLQVKPFNLRKYGVRIKKNDVFDDFYKKVNKFKPGLIGFSLVEPTVDLGISLMKEIKNLKIPIIVGGSHVILDSEGMIDDPNVDMVCTGEGELVICEVAERLSKGKSLNGVRGLWFKEDGRIIKNMLRLNLANMDEIPFSDFSIYEKPRFYKPMAGKIFKMVPVEISRGCFYDCYYCSNHAFKKKFSRIGSWYREKSIGRIFEEIDFYIKHYKVEYLYLVSETFLNMNMKRFSEFVERYKAVKLPFWFNTRPESVNEEKIKLLEGIGCNRITMGLEHGNEEFRRNMLNRPYSNETMENAVKVLRNSKIPFSLNNIIGFPDETRDLIFDTIGLVRKLRLRNCDSISCLMLSPYKGTVMRDICVKKGYIDSKTNVRDHSVDYILKNPFLSKDELLGLNRTFVAYCRLPKKYFPLIKKAEKLTKEGNAYFEKVKKIYAKMYFK